jgi:2-polyprenyl-6-methoxyphenol hydroxylase-like FAD-dependent oxidoreductase
MRSITIIGAGQSGLQLGLGLLAHGYQVRLVSDRTPDALAAGPVLSTQSMFDTAQQCERELGLHFWDDTCPPIEGMAVRVAGPDGQPLLNWHARLDRPARSVDQRLKIPHWMQLFQARGGELIVQQAEVADLEAYAQHSDLVVVAAGKGAIARLFARDERRSPYDAPQRALAMCCMLGLEPMQPFDGVAFNIIPGVGEYFVMPGLTHSGPCHFAVLEGIVGGPLDCWGGVRSTDEHMALMHQLLARWLPCEAERARLAVPADANATLRGRFAPTVRHPVASLPGGALVLGMADAVVLNDPITGQGANNAAKCAARYLQSILQHGDQPFDRAWMQATFEGFWDYAQWVTGWTNAMLQPPPPHVLDLLGAAQSSPAIAHRFVNAFDHPPAFFPWLTDPIAAEALIAEHAAAQVA